MNHEIGRDWVDASLPVEETSMSFQAVVFDVKQRAMMQK